MIAVIPVYAEGMYFVQGDSLFCIADINYDDNIIWIENCKSEVQFREHITNFEKWEVRIIEC